MHHAQNIAETIIREVQVLTPMQLLAAAVCTVLLGYIGLASRLASRA